MYEPQEIMYFIHRFGEDGSCGWAQVVEKKQQVEFPEVILGKQKCIYINMN